MPTEITMADRLRRWREWAGMTQAAVARAVGVSTAAQTMWEQGRTEPTHNNLRKFCKVIGVSLSLFFGDMPADGSTRPASGEAKRAC